MWPLEPLPVGERAPVQPRSIGGFARRQARCRELVPRLEGLRAFRAADALPFLGRLFQHGDRVVGLARGHEGTAEIDAGRDRTGMFRPQHPATAGHHPLRPRDGFLGQSGRAERPGQLAARHEGVGAPGPDNPVADRGQIPPIGHGGAGQASAVHALSGPQQQRMTGTGRPERITGSLLEADGTRPQRCGRPGIRLVVRPCLKQRVRRRPGGSVQHHLRRGQPDGRLNR